MPSCETPFIKNDTNQQLPCGKCPNCLARRTSGWSFRLMQEEKECDTAYFITLTYDTTHVPITKNGFMDLYPRHLQLFFKSLRKSTLKKWRETIELEPPNTRPQKPIRYFAVGEYGGRTMRPHYHIIIFNASPELITENWINGQCHFGQVTNASVGYTLKYMTKKGKIPIHKNDDRQREFSRMSKRLGASYLKKKISSGTEQTSTTECTYHYQTAKKLPCPVTTRRGYMESSKDKLRALLRENNRT